MAYRVTAYKDRNGKRHDEPEAATIADLAIVLGRVGTDPNVLDGLARKLFEAWAEVEQVMVEHSAIVPAVRVVPVRLVE